MELPQTATPAGAIEIRGPVGNRTGTADVPARWHSDSQTGALLPSPASLAIVGYLGDGIGLRAGFLVGIGVYSAVGLGLQQTALLSALQLTYFSIGGGVVGLLLWVVTR
jgi:hypothetical protein